ncbi:MAG: phage tail tape measure protein [Methanosarcina sp.]|nr:phage tail tape measure protein [Methanosarcina sp.]
MVDITQNVNFSARLTNIRKVRSDIQKVAAEALRLKKQLEPGTRDSVKLTKDSMKSFMAASGKAKAGDKESQRAAQGMKVQLARFSQLTAFEEQELALKTALKKKEIDIDTYRHKSSLNEEKRRQTELKYAEEDADTKRRYGETDLRNTEKINAKKLRDTAQTQRTEERNLRNSVRAENNLRKANLKQIANIAKRQNETIKNSFTAAFSLHIVQMYLNPFIRAIRVVVTQAIQTFAEFDKVYANYLAKSTEFTNKVTQQQIMLASVGQTYSINDYADAMERFSASGIDVAKNQKAVIDVLRTAKVANIEYSDAANGVIRTMEAFQMNITQSTAIVDAMANAANASTAELEDMVKWFEYAASSSFQAGLQVQDLAKYLGILSSTGMPGAGAAFRQMLLQFTKADIRQKFKAAFGFTEADFLNMNKVIGTLRTYVQTADDQAAASQKIVSLLGGKVTSQQALNNLIRAEPDLWNRVTAAVQNAGTTQQLYADVTDNTASAIERITNNITILKAAVGKVFGPLVSAIDWFVNGITKLITMSPYVQSALGIVVASFLAVAAVISAAFVGYTTLLGLIYAVNGATALLGGQTDRTTVSYKTLSDALLNLTMVMRGKGTVQEFELKRNNASILSVAELNMAYNRMSDTMVQQSAIIAEMDAIWARSSGTFAQKKAEFAALNAQLMENSAMLQNEARVILESETAKQAAMQNTTRVAAQQGTIISRNVTAVKSSLSAGSAAMYAEMAAIILIMAAFSVASKAMEKGSFNLARAIYVLISALAALKVATMIGGPWGFLAGLATLGVGTAIGESKVSRAQNEYNADRRRASAVRLGAGQVIKQEIDNSVSINGMQITGTNAAKITDSMTGALKYKVH